LIRVLLQTFVERKNDGVGRWEPVYDCFPRSLQEVKLIIPADFGLEVILVYKDQIGEHIFLIGREFIGEEIIL